MKIYLVTEGEYSDYGVSAAFDEKELAQKFIESFGADLDDVRIEEYEINPHKSDVLIGKKPYGVRIKKSGEIISCINYRSPASFSKDGISYYFVDWMLDVPELVVNCFANNKLHANKIANELRGLIIESNKWGIN